MEEASSIAPQPLATTAETTIRRLTYMINGKAVATRVTNDPISGNIGLYYYYGDHLGSTNLLVRHNTEQISSSRARYLPFGDFRTTPTNFGRSDRFFTGHKHNEDLGLIYMNARYDVPTLNRFISADTIVPDPANPQSFNRYSYSRNNPINRVDPSGHRDCELDDHCGPPPQTQSLPWDLTEVLVKEMVYHVQAQKCKRFKKEFL